MSNITIPLAKPAFDGEELKAVQRVLASGWVVQGPEVEEFEKALADIHRVRHCIAVSSGTAALHIAYLALDVNPGDAVFISSFAWPSAANMAMIVGARPVFVDVLPDTYNMDPNDLRLRTEQCIEEGWGTPRAVVPVHEFGLAAEMDPILQIAREHNMDVIEDGACALGATYHANHVGTIGRIGVFSFHPRKAITTGEGGAIVTNDDRIAKMCRMLRNHGQTVVDGKRDFLLAGFNYRMTEIQAAIGTAQLAKFPEILKKRREIAEYYLDNLADCLAISLPVNKPEHTWQTFMVSLDDNINRSEVIDRLASRGIGAGAGAISGHCLKLYQDRFGYTDFDLPVSGKLHEQGLALPLYANMVNSEVENASRQLLRVLSESL